MVNDTIWIGPKITETSIPSSINDSTGSQSVNSLLGQIQNIFSIAYIAVYACGLIGVSIYAIYKGRSTNSDSGIFNGCSLCCLGQMPSLHKECRNFRKLKPTTKNNCIESKLKTFITPSHISKNTHVMLGLSIMHKHDQF